MARTAARAGAPSRKRDRPRSTGAFWFLLGALSGGFGVGFAWMHQARAPVAEVPEPPSRVALPRPTFDFFESLAQEEVLVPIEDPSGRESPLPPAPSATRPPPTPPAAPAPAPVPQASATTYRLQVGSFRDLADAERHKAELALLGVRVDIERAEVAGASTFRLRTGPLEKPAADALGQRLQSQGVSSIAIRGN